MSSFTSRMAEYDSDLRSLFGRVHPNPTISDEFQWLLDATAGNAYYRKVAGGGEQLLFRCVVNLTDAALCALLLEARLHLRRARSHRGVVLYTAAATGDWASVPWGRSTYHATRTAYRVLHLEAGQREERYAEAIKQLRAAQKKL